MAEVAGSMSWQTRIQRWIAQISTPAWIALAVSFLGLLLRIEHARTFDGFNRGSDYVVYVQGVRWMLEHKRPFDFDPTVPYQVRYQPPLWYALGALVLRYAQTERAIAGLSVGGWVIRQGLLAKILKEAIPERRWSILAALSLSALLPLSVLIDGKVNPEGTHSTLFMIAVYALWRMERQSRTTEGISYLTAAFFGLIAGLAVLTKGTSGVLMLGAAFVLVWLAAGSLWREGLVKTLRRLLGPSVVGAVVWCLVVGWWCWPNYKKYGHPFPHDWDIEAEANPKANPDPALYRRPLGWALPFEWQYLRFPIIRSPTEPRPNFWGVVIAGTWSDFYNRGFCRLKGGGTTARVWGGDEGFMSKGRGGSPWNVSGRCVKLFVALVRIGAFLSIAAILAVLQTGWAFVRTRGLRGSLVLPTVTFLGALFIMMFALVYPFDGSAVLNPRYLLPVSTPMLACFGLWHAELGARTKALARIVYLLSFVAIAAVGVLLIFERFGR